MAYNPLHKLSDNIRAIRIALEDKIPSAEELGLLQRYSGFGGIKAILYPDAPRAEWEKLGATAADMRLYEPMQELHELLKEKFTEPEYKSILQSLKNSVLTAFYTPSVVPQTLYQVLQEQGVSIRNIYEPSAGAGIFISEAVNSLKGLEHITAVEKDVLTGKVLQSIGKALPVKNEVHIGGFEDTPGDHKGKHDLVISNIPFGNFTVHDPDYPQEGISGKIHTCWVRPILSACP